MITAIGNEAFEMKLDDTASVKVHLHGATITSWICDSKERLFLSTKSIFDGKKAIRGGIPVVFPNFGPWSNNRPQHGFARIKPWDVKEKQVSDDGSSLSLTLSLKDDEETRALWNYSFELNYHIQLTKSELTTGLDVINTGSETFEFTSLFHSYFRVSNVSNVKLEGLQGVEYKDKVHNGQLTVENNEFITVDEEIDRIYISTRDEHILHEGEDKLRLKKFNCPDTDLWNPWAKKAEAMADFDDDGYLIMFCVQAGNLNTAVKVNGGSSTTVSQTISLHT